MRAYISSQPVHIRRDDDVLVGVGEKTCIITPDQPHDDWKRIPLHVGVQFATRPGAVWIQPETQHEGMQKLKSMTDSFRDALCEVQPPRVVESSLSDIISAPKKKTITQAMRQRKRARDRQRRFDKGL